VLRIDDQFDQIIVFDMEASQRMQKFAPLALVVSIAALLEGCEKNWTSNPGAIDVVNGTDAVCGRGGFLGDEKCKCPDDFSVVGEAPACGDGSSPYFNPSGIANQGCRCEKNLECQPVETQQGFDLDAYISKPWFIQQQMPTEYLPETKNFCVNAMYERKAEKSFWGYTISVRNRAAEADGTPTDSGDFLCAYGYDPEDPAKLAVAPCFTPKIVSGSYWVLAYNEAEGYALVSGGQPKVATPFGCRTGDGTNDSGLWIFTREPQPDFALVDKVRGIALSQGFDLGVLKNVSHVDCKGAPYE